MLGVRTSPVSLKKTSFYGLTHFWFVCELEELFIFQGLERSKVHSPMEQGECGAGIAAGAAAGAGGTQGAAALGTLGQAGEGLLQLLAEHPGSTPSWADPTLGCGSQLCLSVVSKLHYFSCIPGALNKAPKYTLCSLFRKERLNESLANNFVSFI